MMQRSVSTPTSNHPQHYFLLSNQQSTEASISSSSNSSLSDLLTPRPTCLYPSNSNRQSCMAPFPVDPRQDCRKHSSLESTPIFAGASNDRRKIKRRKWRGRLIGNSFLTTETNNNLSYMMPEDSSTASSLSSELPALYNTHWMESSANSFAQFKSFPLEKKYLYGFKSRKSWCLKCSTVLLMLAIVLILIAILLFFANNSMKPHKWRGFPSIASFRFSKVDKVVNIRNESEYYATFPSPLNTLVKQDWNEHNRISEALMALFDGSNIAENLKWISATVHVAGTVEQLRLMDRLETEYQDLGFEVTSYEYEDVMLSYPDYQNPNTIHLWEENTEKWILISNGLAQELGPKEALDQQTDSRAFVWWNAYSANGSAFGQVVFANYGTQEDYDYLETLNITTTGKIVVIRYGAVFRGDKVQKAEQRGAIGVILYSDPYDFAPDLLKNNKTFPDQIWLPPSGAQRGTLLRTNGDPATPFFPSKPYVHRSTSEESLRSQGILPSIPVTSIGYRDAIKIFQSLDGAKVLVNRWRGSMQTEYRFTGSPFFRLQVNTFISQRPIKNFAAVMYGREEPDRWVLLGNHADAWVNGAIDPGTGTATMLEMARVLSNFSKSSGWRPRRTLAFCQWDAEEFGLIGSTEWVEEMKAVLEKRAVAYINVDNINGNTTLQVKAVPLLYRAIVDASKRVAHPLSGTTEDNNSHRALFDAWNFYSQKGAIAGDKSIPAIQLPNSGSDFQRFISFGGVPVADLRLESAPIYSYMLYHSMYETAWTSEKLVDPSRRVYSSLGKMWLELGRNLAESLIIPFNVEDYGLMLGEYCIKMDAQLLHLGIDFALGEDFYSQKLKFLEEAIKAFQESSIRIQQIVQAFNNNEIALSLRQIEMINSRLQYIERCFIVDAGIFKDRAFFRHAVFTPSEHELYSGVTFALIIDPAVKWSTLLSQTGRSKGKTKEKSANYWLETVRNGFTKLQYTIESAVLLMNLDAF